MADEPRRSVGLNHITAATAILGQIAFSGGEGIEPEATLMMWRANEGFDTGALETAAHSSAMESVAEIEERIEQEGGLTTGDLLEYIEREYIHALQIGWIVRARSEKRDANA